MNHTGIAVIESSWFRKNNVSVRGLFELISNIKHQNPNTYHYEMANCKAAMKEAILRLASYTEVKYIYIASHGDENGVSIFNEENVSRSEIRNILEKIEDTPRSILQGLYFGTCEFGTAALAEYIFQKNVCVTWVAGYANIVPWIDSSAFDLLFFNEFLNTSENKSEIQRIKETATRLEMIVPDLIKELGFGIYLRKKNVGGVKDLLVLVKMDK